MTANPYQSPNEAQTEKALRDPQPSPNVSLVRFLALDLLLLISIASLCWMFIGGIITYAPSGMTPSKMQNIYLDRMWWYGEFSIVLQLVMLGILATMLPKISQ